MKKRIVCVLLTLIMLISLVPATAISAAAATNTVSESAIYVLKQLEGYQKNCKGGYIGYGARCPECLGETGVNAEVEDCGNIMFEKEADAILREELKKLDKAVNSFASNNGLGLTQGQHDALVLFSFQNGTAWTIGTGEFQTAIKSGAIGTKFVDAICKWDYDTSDDYRRMVEANMYLNGVYSSAKPSRYIGVRFNVTGGFMNEDPIQYFDVASPHTITLAPTPANVKDRFLGWYTETDGGKRVAVLHTTHATQYDKSCPALIQLYAVWQLDGTEPGDNGYEIAYTLTKGSLASTTVYNVPNGSKVTTYINEHQQEVKISLANTLNVIDDFVDEKGVVWARIAAIAEVDGAKKILPMGWVKVKSGTTTGAASNATMDLDVTVTNTYVNIRNSASVTSTKKGTFNYGAKLRIINVKNGSDGFLWGQVATSAEDNTPIGWVALMYTDYDAVVANSNNNSSSANNSAVVATATITYNGYVNVRSDAGINNQIVGALSQGVTVELYETKYVNGIQWGRCSTGWFCLTYANVTRLIAEDTTSDAGFTNYVFSGTLVGVTKDTPLHEVFYKSYVGDEHIDCIKVKDAEGNEKCKTLGTTKATVSNLVRSGDYTWGKTNYGWIMVSDENGDPEQIKLDVAKYYVVADTLTIRDAANTEAARVDLLVKGTEFDVTKVILVGETIWGYANKVGETDLTYWGWANLSNENVSRNGAPAINNSNNTSAAVKMAKVVGTNSVNVRIHGATYANIIGKLTLGTSAPVLGQKDGWYKLDIDVDNDPSTDSWVSGTYLEIYEAAPGSNSGSGNASGSTGTTSLTGTGIVANTYTGVNIRTGPGTGNALVGKYLTGTTVEILEVTTHGASKWGRTEKGWVCMDYIVMMENFNPNGTVGGGNNTTSSSTVAIYTGKLTEDTTVYKERTTKKTSALSSEPTGEIVAQLPAGYPITLHEIIVQLETDYESFEDQAEEEKQESNEGGMMVTRTTYWARVNDGYIFAPGDCIALDTLDEHAYTVVVDKTPVYDDWDPDSRAKKDFTLDKDTNVLVTKLQIVNATVFGYAECTDYAKEGWVDLANMNKGFASSVGTEKEEENAGNTDNSGNTGNTGNNQSTGPVQGSTGNTTGGYANASGYKYTGKVINTNEVNVRATASTGANITTKLKNGASLVIYETVISEGMAWGRCDSGWIYLYYVDLAPTTNGAVDARVVYNDNTIIYADMNMSEATGSTYAKMAVIDIYEIVGRMARTELGWVNMDNLL